MTEQNQWLTREQAERRNRAVSAYLGGVRDARAWLDSLAGESPEATRDALEARMEQVLEQAGPGPLGWRETLSAALARLAKEDARRAKLRAVLLQYETSRAARVAAEERRKVQAEAAEQAHRAAMASIDAAIAQARAAESEARGALYDLRGVARMTESKRGEILAALDDQEVREYDARMEAEMTELLGPRKT